MTDAELREISGRLERMPRFERNELNARDAWLNSYGQFLADAGALLDEIERLKVENAELQERVDLAEGQLAFNGLG